MEQRRPQCGNTAEHPAHEFGDHYDANRNLHFPGRCYDAVQHRGEHVTVMRYGQTAAVVVPAWWYEWAKAEIKASMSTEIEAPEEKP